MTFRRLSSVLLALLVAVASASDKNPSFQVVVLSSDSYQFQGPPDAPRDCGLRDYSAYCLSSSPETYIANTMIVRTADGTTLHIACTVYNQWSHCADLPVNQTFPARKVKRGLEITYPDQHHKLRKQVYEIESEDDSNR